MANPVLVELTRGALVESAHVGALAVARANGELVASLGDVRRPIYPRSAIKALQCLPLVETGAADRFGFGDREIALACSSHSGTPEHAELAASMLARAGLDGEALGCGAHEPSHEPSARDLFRDGARPSALHNNCSGKHAGMLATCVHCGDAAGGYLDPGHAHQQRIGRVLQAFCGEGFVATRFGTDGCSAPNWAIPLRDLARAFAALVTGEGLAPDRRRAADRITRACMAEPHLVAGPGRLDTIAMQAMGGQVFMKTGAEGVYCGAFPKLGIGFAIKIDDGQKRASEAVAEALIRRVLPAAPAFGRHGPITNWVGTEVGATRLAGDAARLFDRLAI